MKVKNSTEILIKNLKKHYKVNSLRDLGRKVGYSDSVILNWSGRRTSPSLKQISDIAYGLNVHASELFVEVEDNVFTLETPVWKDNVINTVFANLGRLQKEREVDALKLDENSDIWDKSHRTFLRCIGEKDEEKNKSLNLQTLDKLAIIFNEPVSDFFKEAEHAEKN